MRIVSEKTIKHFWLKHKEAETPLRDFINLVSKADWQNLADIKILFPNADYHNDLVIFNVGGNKFRIVLIIRFKKHLAFVRAVLTHKEYDIHSNWCDCKEFRKRRN